MKENNSKTFSFIWDIENFLLCYHDIGESILSPPFMFEDHAWYLKLFPRGAPQSDGNFISIFLFKTDNENITVDYKISMITSEILKSYEYKDAFFSSNFGKGQNKFIDNVELREKMTVSAENILTVACEIKVRKPIKLIASGCEARTTIGIDQCSFQWKVNINDSSDWTKAVILPFLSVPIEILLTAPDDAFEISIQNPEEVQTEAKWICCELSLLDRREATVISKCDTHLFDSSVTSYCWKFPSFFTKSELFDKKDIYLRSNAFTLKCKMSISNGSMSSSIENYSFPALSAINLKSEGNLCPSLHDDLRTMLTLKKHCDVKLQVGNTSIPAHKALLAARSPVFSAMFDQNMLETETGRVDIKDMNAESVRSFLEFMYTGSIEEMNTENALNLLIAAEKYQVLSLKEKCSTYLISILSALNVCDVLTVADIIACMPLKNSAMYYIKENTRQVLSSSNWSEWVKSNNKLATEILLLLSNSKECIM